MLSSVFNFIYNWQTLIAGLLGALAAIVVVAVTLRSESRRRAQEVFALKVALGAEIRQFALRALEAGDAIRNFIEKRTEVTVHKLDDVTRFPAPIIYHNTTNILGALGATAHSVVIFYGRIDLMRDAIRRLRDEYGLDGAVSRLTLDHFRCLCLEACGETADILPAFAGTPRSEHDQEFISRVQESRRACSSTA